MVSLQSCAFILSSAAFRAALSFFTCLFLSEKIPCAVPCASLKLWLAVALETDPKTPFPCDVDDVEGDDELLARTGGAERRIIWG